MALDTQMRRRRRLSMTSLIDVIFLLLLFFMLTSTFSRFGDVELMAGGQGAGGESDRQKLFLSLRPAGLWLNGAPVDPLELPDRIATLRNGRDALALVSLDAATTSQGLVDILAVLHGLAGLQVLVLE
ncbi:MAG: biopolymer transporter ExbD [Marinibacterium sp.]|nr:biopolymer transporter ExbD [Marinibacterium sp.]